MDLERELLIFVAKLDLFVTDVLPYILIGIVAIIGGLVIFWITDITSDIRERKKKAMKTMAKEIRDSYIFGRSINNTEKRQRM